MVMKSKLRNLIPAYIASIIDISITIAHQSPEYWQGDLTQANEGNPIGGSLMAMDVSGIFIVSGVWLLLIGPLGYYLPRKISKVFLLFVLVAHSYGASTWISPRYGFWAAMLLILINSAIYVIVDEMNKKEKIKSKQFLNI
jgi:hypothetical protein